MCSSYRCRSDLLDSATRAVFLSLPLRSYNERSSVLSVPKIATGVNDLAENFRRIAKSHAKGSVPRMAGRRPCKSPRPGHRPGEAGAPRTSLRANGPTNHPGDWLARWAENAWIANSFRRALPWARRIHAPSGRPILAPEQIGNQTSSLTWPSSYQRTHGACTIHRNATAVRASLLTRTAALRSDRAGWPGGPGSSRRRCRRPPAKSHGDQRPP